MTNYDWSIGSTGTMRITVNTSTVEFWITANNGTTYAYDMPWGYTVNGVTDNSNQYRYEAGAYWERVGVWTVTTSQTVTFRLYDTGTSGLGSGETHSVYVSRTSTAKVPSAPSIVALSSITSSSVSCNWTDGANNGAAIDNRQVGYGTSSSSPQYTEASSNNAEVISGLIAGRTYYFWARSHNSVGWGPWGPRSSAITTGSQATTKVKVGTEYKPATAYVRVGGIWKVAIPWVKVAGVWKQAS